MRELNIPIHLSLKEKIVGMTQDERKRLGINKSTLFYMKKNLKEGKNIKIYNKVFDKLNYNKIF